MPQPWACWIRFEEPHHEVHNRLVRYSFQLLKFSVLILLCLLLCESIISSHCAVSPRHNCSLSVPLSCVMYLCSLPFQSEDSSSEWFPKSTPRTTFASCSLRSAASKNARFFATRAATVGAALLWFTTARKVQLTPSRPWTIRKY